MKLPEQAGLASVQLLANSHETTIDSRIASAGAGARRQLRWDGVTADRQGYSPTGIARLM